MNWIANGEIANNVITIIADSAERARDIDVIAERAKLRRTNRRLLVKDKHHTKKALQNCIAT